MNPRKPVPPPPLPQPDDKKGNRTNHERDHEYRMAQLQTTERQILEQLNRRIELQKSKERQQHFREMARTILLMLVLPCLLVGFILAGVWSQQGVFVADFFKSFVLPALTAYIGYLAGQQNSSSKVKPVVESKPVEEAADH